MEYKKKKAGKGTEPSPAFCGTTLVRALLVLRTDGGIEPAIPLGDIAPVDDHNFGRLRPIEVRGDRDDRSHFNELVSDPDFAAGAVEMHSHHFGGDISHVGGGDILALPDRMVVTRGVTNERQRLRGGSSVGKYRTS